MHISNNLNLDTDHVTMRLSHEISFSCKVQVSSKQLLFLYQSFLLDGIEAVAAGSPLQPPSPAASPFTFIVVSRFSLAVVGCVSLASTMVALDAMSVTTRGWMIHTSHG